MRCGENVGGFLSHPVIRIFGNIAEKLQDKEVRGDLIILSPLHFFLTPLMLKIARCAVYIISPIPTNCWISLVSIQVLGFTKSVGDPCVLVYRIQSQ